MAAIVKEMRREVASAIERETDAEVHPQIVFELTRDQLASLRERARLKRDEYGANQCAKALADQDTQLADELAGESFPVHVHWRAMMSDLAHVKGIVKAVAERENRATEQISKLLCSVHAKAAGLLESAEKKLKLDVKIKIC